MQPGQQKRIIIITLIVLLVVIAVSSIFAYINANKNPYGESINIIGYDENVKNLSKDYKFAISAALYDIVNFNSSTKVKPGDVKDATLRAGSAQQTEHTKNTQYSGSFIVDIESLKQSYKIQYSYSTKPNDPFVAGYPIYAGCLAEEDVIYKDFDCKSVSRNEEAAKEDPIISFLPHKTLSYELKADTTGEKLVVYALLRIPEIDLSGDLASKQQMVALYKKEVTDWITEQGLNVSDYTIKYNYSDNGDPINIYL
ncbi:MAG: hypothetical protein WAQ27_04325 [Candidatus Microsaccharimonas sp.]